MPNSSARSVILYTKSSSSNRQQAALSSPFLSVLPSKKANICFFESRGLGSKLSVLCLLSTVDAPLPHFEGITPESPALAPIAAQTSGPEPVLTDDDRTKYGGMFMACGPVNGLLDGDKAREVFLKSKLPVDKLSQIWYVFSRFSSGATRVFHGADAFFSFFSFPPSFNVHTGLLPIRNNADLWTLQTSL